MNKLKQYVIAHHVALMLGAGLLLKAYRPDLAPVVDAITTAAGAQ